MVQVSANKPLAITKERLKDLVPLSTLSAAGLATLADVLQIENVSTGVDPTRQGAHHMQAVYLLTGDLGVRYLSGKKVILRAGTVAANNPIDTVRLGIRDTIALTPIEIVRIDLDVLSVSQTWDQMITLTNRMHGLFKKVLERVTVEKNHD
jgi:hypothetical protein